MEYIFLQILHSLGILFACFLLQTIVIGKSLTKSMGDYELGKWNYSGVAIWPRVQYSWNIRKSTLNAHSTFLPHNSNQFLHRGKDPCSLTKHEWWRRITWRLLVITIFIQRILSGCGDMRHPGAPGATGLVLDLCTTDRNLASHLNLSQSQFLIEKVEGQTSRFLRIFQIITFMIYLEQQEVKGEFSR